MISIRQLLLPCSGSMLTEHTFDYNMASHRGSDNEAAQAAQAYETCVCLISYGSIKWLPKLHFSFF